MSFIRTVLGDIDPKEAGVCYAHEHVIIDPSYTTEQNPDFELSSVDLAVKELSAFRQAGGNTMIDTLPCDGGRNVVKLAQVSQKTGVHIVCPTGLHLSKYYPKGHWSERLDESEMEELFVADIEEGVDANDYGGPKLARTGHRAGVIKVAAGKDTLNAHERALFRAAARASLRTGCPIITHTEEGTAALEQALVLIESGAQPGHIILSHTDRRPDPSYHRAILAMGVCLEYDSAFRWKTAQNPTTALIVELARQFPNQLMLGMDAARSTYWSSYGGRPGLTFLLTTYRSQLLDAGVSKPLIERLFTQNPQRAFSFYKAS